MDEYYFSVNIDESRKLCIAPLTSRLVENADSEIVDSGGHFLFESSGPIERPLIRILAKIMSEDALFELRDRFQMA